jgi:hypothetical protein
VRRRSNILAVYIYYLYNNFKKSSVLGGKLCENNGGGH